jgi:hypothetical protein
MMFLLAGRSRIMIMMGLQGKSGLDDRLQKGYIIEILSKH